MSSATPQDLFDRGGDVTVAIAASLLAEDRLNFHPLVNDRTTSVTPVRLLEFLDATGHPIRRLAPDEI